MIIVKDDKTKITKDWKQFLSTEDNKKQFIQILLETWSKDSYASKLKGRSLIFIREGEAFMLNSPDGISTVKTAIATLDYSPEETDSRFILYSF